MDVYEELKFLRKFKKKIGRGGGGRGCSESGCSSGWGSWWM